METNDVVTDVIAARIRAALDGIEQAVELVRAAERHLAPLRGVEAGVSVGVVQMHAGNLAIALEQLGQAVTELPIDGLALERVPGLVEQAMYRMQLTPVYQIGTPAPGSNVVVRR